MGLLCVDSDVSGTFTSAELFKIIVNGRGNMSEEFLGIDRS